MVLLAALLGGMGAAPLLRHPELGYDTGGHLTMAAFLLRNGFRLAGWNPEWFGGFPSACRAAVVERGGER